MIIFFTRFLCCEETICVLLSSRFLYLDLSEFIRIYINFICYNL